MTCGLFFSLGHSTVVVAVVSTCLLWGYLRFITVQTVAIAISSAVYDKMHGVGNVGGIVGKQISLRC